MTYPSSMAGRLHFVLLAFMIIWSCGLLITNFVYILNPELFYTFYSQLDLILLTLHKSFFVLSHVTFVVWMFLVHVVVNHIHPNYRVNPAGYIVRMLPFVSIWGLASTFNQLRLFFNEVVPNVKASSRLKVYIPLLYVTYIFAWVSYPNVHGAQADHMLFLMLGMICYLVMSILFLFVTNDVSQAVFIAVQHNMQHDVQPGVQVHQAQTGQAIRWKRLAAQLIDSAAFILIMMVAVVSGALLDQEEGSLFIVLLTVLGLVGYLVYYAVHLSINGQTIGKWMLGLRIVKSGSGEPGGFIHNYLLRSFVNYIITSVIPFYGLVDACFIFSSDARCLHDRIAGTMVIDVRKAAVRREMYADEGAQSV